MMGGGLRVKSLFTNATPLASSWDTDTLPVGSGITDSYGLNDYLHAPTRQGTINKKPRVGLSVSANYGPAIPVVLIFTFAPRLSLNSPFNTYLNVGDSHHFCFAVYPSVPLSLSSTTKVG